MKIMKNMRKKALALLLAALPMVAAAQQPTVKTPPEGKAYTINSTAQAVSSGTITYQWFRNDVPINSATSASYTVPANLAYGTNVEFKRRADCGGGGEDEVWSNAVLVSFVPDQSAKITGNALVCLNQTDLTYSVPYVSNVTYTWTLPTGWTKTAGGTSNIITVTPPSSTSSGTISVTPSYSTTGYAVTGTTRTLEVMTISGPSQPSTITGASVTCPNATGLTYSVTKVSGITYTWTVPNGWTITTGQGTNSIIVTAGTYGGIISVTAAICGSSAVRTMSVGVANSPSQPSEITGSTSVCHEQSYSYSVTNVDNVTYSWVVPNGWNITGGQGTNSITVTAGSTGGNVSVTPVNCGGNNGTARMLKVNVAPFPTTPSFISKSTNSFCTGHSMTYSVTNVPGNTYTWTVPKGWNITDGQGTNSITVTIGSVGGIVKVTPSICGTVGVSLSEEVVFSTALPAVSSITASTSIVCAGQTGLVYSVTNVPGVTYNWSVTGTGWTITSGNGTNSVIAKAGTATGTISVTPSNCNGTGTSNTRTVTLNQIPTNNVSITIPYTCHGQTASISVTEIEGATDYTWTVPNDWEIISGQGTSHIEAIVRTSNLLTNISVVPTVCGIAQSAISRNTYVSSPTRTLSSSATSNSICPGQSLSYWVTGAVDSCVWTVNGWTLTSGQGTNSITCTADSSIGIINVTYKYDNCGLWTTGSLQTYPATFNANQLNGYIAIGGSKRVCAGQTHLDYGFTSYDNSSIIPDFTYTWTVPSGWSIINGQGTNKIMVTAGTTNDSITVTPSSCGINGPKWRIAVMTGVCGGSCGNGNGVFLLGNCWATKNVDDYQTFATRPDMYTKFYQWNRATAYSASNPLTPAWVNTRETAATWTNNPCPSGWTVGEVSDLTLSSHPLGGVWALANTRGNAVAGAFYGPGYATCTLPDNTATCVFLPASGVRYDNGDLGGVGTEVLYWSRTGSSGTGINAYGTNLEFTSIYTTDKRYGMNVRCVQNVQ